MFKLPISKTDQYVGALDGLASGLRSILSPVDLISPNWLDYNFHASYAYNGILRLFRDGENIDVANRRLRFIFGHVHLYLVSQLFVDNRKVFLGNVTISELAGLVFVRNET